MAEDEKRECLAYDEAQLLRAIVLDAVIPEDVSRTEVTARLLRSGYVTLQGTNLTITPAGRNALRVETEAAWKVGIELFFRGDLEITQPDGES